MFLLLCQTIAPYRDKLRFCPYLCGFVRQNDLQVAELEIKGSLA